MEFIQSEDENGYVSFRIPLKLSLLRGLTIREYSKRGDYLNHYYKHDRRGEKSVWVHNANGLKEFDSAEECKKDLIACIRASVEDIKEFLLTESQS